MCTTIYLKKMELEEYDNGGQKLMYGARFLNFEINNYVLKFKIQLSQPSRHVLFQLSTFQLDSRSQFHPQYF